MSICIRNHSHSIEILKFLVLGGADEDHLILILNLLLI